MADSFKIAYRSEKISPLLSFGKVVYLDDASCKLVREPVGGVKD